MGGAQTSLGSVDGCSLSRLREWAPERVFGGPVIVCGALVFPPEFTVAVACCSVVSFFSHSAR